MNYEQGLANLEQALKEDKNPLDSEEYLNFIGFKRQLWESVESERRFAVLSPQEQERRERIYRELDRLALRHTGKSFTQLCSEKRLVSGKRGSARVLSRRAQTANSSRAGQSVLSDAHALIIGVGDYDHPRYPNLPVTIQDAKAIGAILSDPTRGGYKPENVSVVTGEQTTVDGIQVAFKKIAESTSADSIVFVYFSGHGGRAVKAGIRRTFLCPRDADPENLAATAIAGEKFDQLLASIPARRVLVVLDACHAAGSAEIKGADGTVIWKAGLPEDFFEALSEGNGRVIIASSKAEQFSYVREAGDFSLFTWHFRNALLGKAAVRGDGFIHVLDVFHYLSENVQIDKPSQTPILKVSDLDLNFAIAFQPLETT